MGCGAWRSALDGLDGMPVKVTESFSALFLTVSSMISMTSNLESWRYPLARDTRAGRQ